MKDIIIALLILLLTTLVGYLTIEYYHVLFTFKEVIT
jgi:hypothetical protein